MDLTLIMYREDGSHRPFVVNKAETLIGRREDCDLRIAVSDVSRKHSKLTLRDGALKIEDLGSSNGTFVNGSRVNAAMLKAGDVVQIGPVLFVLQVDGEPSDDALAERVAAAKAGGAGKAPAGKAAAAAPARKPAPAADDEIDELLILNDSAGASGLEIDLDDDKPKH